jgi:hypothetical protein
MMCTCVSEEGGGEKSSKSVDSEDLSLLSWRVWDQKRHLYCHTHLDTSVSRTLGQTLPLWVVITDTPVYVRECGGGRRGRCGFRSVIPSVNRG